LIKEGLGLGIKRFSFWPVKKKGEPVSFSQQMVGIPNMTLPVAGSEDRNGDQYMEKRPDWRSSCHQTFGKPGDNGGGPAALWTRDEMRSHLFV
jgi:hypothetical protein